MRETEDEIHLDSQERQQVEEHAEAPTEVVYEAIRRAGLHELERPVSGLWWSGVAAGIALSLSVLVLAANLVGCAVAATAMSLPGLIPEKIAEGALEIARSYASMTPTEQFLRGIPAGFLIAALVWMLPRQDGAGEIIAIVMVTWLIAVAEMSHVVAGSTKLFMLAIAGELDLWGALWRDTAPALAGNVLGGTGIFSALAYAQVRERA